MDNETASAVMALIYRLAPKGHHAVIRPIQNQGENTHYVVEMTWSQSCLTLKDATHAIRFIANSWT